MGRVIGGITSRREFLKTATAGTFLAGCAGLGIRCRPGFPGRLSVEPSSVRSDEPFVVRVEGLPPGERVVLSSAFDDARGQEWSATAFFEADANGVVDTLDQAPAGGSYDVQDPMGLVWSALGPDPYTERLRSSPLRITARVGETERVARVGRYPAAYGAVGPRPGSACPSSVRSRGGQMRTGPLAPVFLHGLADGRGRRYPRRKTCHLG